ncbi:MAG: hypothetical protein IPL99_29350 [Candidatus Competibacteraceae bacterium]|nr:hypothetical protein [Candidatus Competibacteraceae bacterium]
MSPTALLFHLFGSQFGNPLLGFLTQLQQFYPPRQCQTFPDLFQTALRRSGLKMLPRWAFTLFRHIFQSR